MDAQKEFFLKQIEQLHQNNKIRGSQDYMNYIGNNYEFLIQLVREQETQINELERKKENVKEAYRDMEYWSLRYREQLAAVNGNPNYDYWAWIPDEDNHLETLSCPVLIPAEWLRNLIDEAKQTQLTKYERVVEAAKILIQKARDAKNATGDNGQPDWYEYSTSDFDALMDAVDELEESK